MLSDHFVEVDQRQIKPPRELACDFAFAATHKTDDDDWSAGFHLTISDWSKSKNSGKETAADSEPRISVSPSAIRAATEKAIAMR